MSELDLDILKKLGKKDFSSPQSLNLEENPLRAKEALNNLLFALEHFKLDLFKKFQTFKILRIYFLLIKERGREVINFEIIG